MPQAQRPKKLLDQMRYAQTRTITPQVQVTVDAAGRKQVPA